MLHSGYYAVLNRYCKAPEVCRATKHPEGSTAENSLYTAILESPMRLISMDVFTMPEVTVEGEVFDCAILVVDRHSGYIVAVLGKKYNPRRRTTGKGTEWGCKPRLWRKQ